MRQWTGVNQRSGVELGEIYGYDTVQVYEDHLSIFTVGTLQYSARMASILFKGRLKKNIVVALTGRVLGLRDRLTTMTCNELFCELCAKSDTDFLPSLLSAYFQTVFGGDVATAL